MNRIITFIIICCFFSCTKKNHHEPLENVTNKFKILSDSNGTKGVYTYEKPLNDDKKIFSFEGVLKNWNKNRNFDKNFKKYLFPFVRKISQTDTKLSYYLFKNEYEEAIYGNSSYPFFVSDNENKIIYFWKGDSLSVNKSSFKVYTNVRDTVFYDVFIYDKKKKIFKKEK
jgi:hypothetical protein